jgi:hypothetical protein
MKCTICGKTSLPGSALCGPCKAALKRARYVTVQEDRVRPSMRDSRRAPVRKKGTSPRAETGPARAAATPPPALRRTSGRRVLAAVVAVAGIGAAAYFGQHELRAVPTAMEAGPTGSPIAPVGRPVEIPAPPAAVLLPPSVASDAATASKVTAPHDDNATAAAKAAAIVGKSRGRVALFAPQTTTPSMDLPEGPAVVPEPEKPAPLAPAPPDRWQLMRDATAQCDREGGLGGFVCGQRVKMQYCDGYWGKVAQCPGAATEADYRR